MTSDLPQSGRSRPAVQRPPKSLRLGGSPPLDSEACESAAMCSLRRQRLRVVGLLVLGVVALGLFARTYQVHEETWEWRLRATAAPPKVCLDERDYRRDDGPPLPAPSTGAVELGQTSAGTYLYGRSNGRDAPTVLYARTQRGFLVYSLLGGP